MPVGVHLEVNMIHGQIYRDQTEYELALPPADEPEAPDMSSEIGDLMTGADTELVSYEAFKRCADEDLYDLVPDGFCVELILAASRSSDPAMKLMAKAARKALEEHAGTMLDAAWEKEQGRDRSNDF
jgi:hypothetical protein